MLRSEMELPRGSEAQRRVHDLVGVKSGLSEKDLYRLFANDATWAHTIVEVCKLLGLDGGSFPSKKELLVLSGHGDPRIVM